MSGQGPSVDKGMNTILVCQESYACGGSDEAAFECDECGSLQCVLCELELHRQERMRNHDRVRIAPGHVPFCDSCKGNNSGFGVNRSRLRAVVRCQGCKMNLCLDCQKRTHSGVNKRKHPVTPYPPPVKAQDSSLDTGDGGEMEALKAKLEEVCNFLLVDEKEEMQLKDEEDFVSRLDCRPEELLKVVSIFGNTGEGKSHTLNHTFFLGREVFQTSPTQESCTVGVWAAMDPIHRVVVIDTEGLLGADNPSESAERLLQERFRKLGLFPEAFSSIQYRGTRTYNPPTDFSGLLRSLEQQLDNNTTRSPRSASVIYRALQALSERFSGDIPEEHLASNSFFPDEYFTCSGICLSCGSGCENSMNHLKEEVNHEAKHRCRYSAQYDNRIYTCKACYEGGKEVIVVPKATASSDSPWFGLAIYAWSGYVIECPNCGVIYRSRQYWYGNQDPVDTVVRTEIQHIWPGSDGFLKDNNNAAQRLLDGVNYISQSVSELSVKPAKAVTSWLTDQIAPAYWKPNSLILKCWKCSEVFQDNDTKHHCRACGEGFCDGCSTKNRPVPERGWGLAPVRVCDACFQNRGISEELLDAELEEEEGGTLSRRVGEAVQNTLGAVVTATYIPLGLMKDAARPAYWVPDQNIRCCCECQRDFSAPRLSIHHCRACGQGVCDDCSPERRAVPSRGWDHPVRVCNTCHQKPGDL
ncbi:zinc finger FYVE domain-containing protein 1-like isoform X2 [Salvelinus fontinalis]|uniref:zinc finger FYVE domain-containing protein 1-like isoform X2 n=1 Tax=Salvelinus fontinalis TaxID=8038 RepID=UPI002485B345|nr:zinc finger FYVE domain-containing protein 1-like isoform X2 [Salvelinus fontinalis]